LAISFGKFAVNLLSFGDKSFLGSTSFFFSLPKTKVFPPLNLEYACSTLPGWNLPMLSSEPFLNIK
jgi:hypothetical protein